MGVLSVYHMDIEDFIKAKSEDPNKLNHFNISVMVDDDFMWAVENNKNIFLHYPVYDENGFILKNEEDWIYKKEVNAKELWNLIIKMAYDNGEPGIFFYDNMRKDNNLWYIENIVATNPCAEYLAGTIYGKSPITGEELNPNDFGGACNLGSIFLHNLVDNPFTKEAKFNYTKLAWAVKNGVRILDNIIDKNSFPNPIYENYQKNFRTIGLGITGLADTLAMLNVKYNSEEGRKIADEIIEEIAIRAYIESIQLAKEKESFPFLDKEKFISSGYIQKHLQSSKRKEDWYMIVEGIKEYGIRNAKILSIAPTGTLSLTFGNNCSSGLEPIFCLEYDRKVKMSGQSEEDTKIVKMEDYAYSLWKTISKDKNIVKKDIFTTALDMNVLDHLLMLHTIAYHVDMSCSKTINIPEDYSFEDTKEVYMSCWKNGIKGCTIFRPNPIRQGVLLTKKEDKKDKDNTSSETALSRGEVIKVTDNVIGRKRKLMTGCGSLHCTAYFDPDTGKLLEVYLSKGSTGGCNNFMIGLSRMISLSARAGVDIFDIIDQLNSTGACPSYAVRKATKNDTSKGSCCPMAVGNALLDMYNEVQETLGNIDVEEKEIEMKKGYQKCPECGEYALVFEGGCNSCKACGYSKCS